jgi:hypothetical protein
MANLQDAGIIKIITTLKEMRDSIDFEIADLEKLLAGESVKRKNEAPEVAAARERAHSTLHGRREE